jgi:16S rRNA A1518/A1519 N6-dimethyltransferase RsmA/KsgA/DIM1 with predicted DNA glycosylase/AP lyase activity
LEQRRTWYSPAAEAYNKARPHYPKALIDRVVELTQLADDATVLEIGCGPGTATVTFAELGFSMLCLEPNPDFCAIAHRNCAKYAKVEIQNTSFEEWNLEAKRFNAVLAATSIHWIPPEVAYPKVANALQDDGALILLWNVPAIPSYEVYHVLQDV